MQLRVQMTVRRRLRCDVRSTALAIIYIGFEPGYRLAMTFYNKLAMLAQTFASHFLGRRKD